MKAVGRKTPNQNERDRKQRAADLVHSPVRGFLGRHALLDVALDVLNDDDSVIDDDADREHEAEEGQRVEGDPHDAHDEERADKRHRNGQDRDDGRPPCLQEQNHDENDKHQGFEQRVDDGVDRELNELRRIIDDRVSDPPAGNPFSGAPSRL